MSRLVAFATPFAAALPFAILPASASAEPTRAEYVAQADSICQSPLTTFRQNTAKLRATANRLRIIFFAPNAQQKADSPPQRRLFKPVGRLYQKAAALIDSQTDSLSQLAVPSADSATITQWLASRRVLARDLQTAGEGLSAKEAQADLPAVSRLA